MKKCIILFLSLILALALFASCGNPGEEQVLPENDENVQTEPVDLVHAEITIKDYGTVKLELDPNEAPITVENFVKLAKDGFYTGLKFHRIMNGFMIQGGANPEVNLDPIVGEFSDNGYANTISHTEGVISMARTPDYNSATSQFFITVADATFLDGQYAAFGRVTEGLDICKKIASDSRPIDDNGTIPEDEQPIIESIVITD